MLLEFKVSNLRSIGEEQVMSLIPASKQKEYESNILESESYKALNAAAIYGANGSGKSNLILAMGIFMVLVRDSARFSSTTKMPYDPFLLREDWNDRPTRMELTFILSGNRYRYGFQYGQEGIQQEWLFRKSIGREVNIFAREGELIDPTSSLKAHAKIIDAAIAATKPNGLFLASCDMMNIPEAVALMGWFNRFNVVDSAESDNMEAHVLAIWDEPNFREQILDYMRRMGTGVADIQMRNSREGEEYFKMLAGEDIRNAIAHNYQGYEPFTIYSSHHIYDKNGKKTDNLISWEFAQKESAGTKKAFYLSAPVLLTLKFGGVLIIDEIEAKMHPLMTLDTINMFLDEKLNSRRAQLIFATHDTNLLTYAKLRRDQIYFAEKNSWESTEIYSLSDFTYPSDMSGPIKERPDTDKEKRYFEGRYGAVPMLGKLNRLLQAQDNG